MNTLLPDSGRLPHDLRDLERRSQALLGHDLARHPGAAAFRSLEQSLLANIRQIQLFRQAAGAGAEIDVARAVPAANLIKSSHELLDTVVDQIALCESTARLSSIAAELARRLISQQRLSYHEILPLFGRIFDEVQGVSRLSRWTPVPGLSLMSIAASSTGDADSVFFVEGLIAARVLVWTLNGESRAAERLPQVVLAALLQDVGRMLESRSGSQKRRLSPKRIEWFKRNHPSIGAALLGAIRGAPVGLALVVGQHHERLDGRGFPRALMARDILPAAAVLAAASRFAGMSLEFDAEPYSEFA
ncbi:MAG TPA: HD domain-containing phosphohydrolase, partial [Pirellulales bacterium]|nr:HD domain-containing phosphohydrolase [Pirellulales bacterium]